MCLFVPTLIGIALAMLQGGSLRHLATLPIRGVWAIVLSFAIQAVLYATVLHDSDFVHQAGAGLYIGAIGLVSFGVLSNWRLGGAARIVFLGLALNAAAIVANGGHMPVDATALRTTQGAAQVQAMAAHDPQDYNRELATASSRLLVLSDEIPVRLPVSHGYVCSIGDLLIAAGAAALAYKGTRRPWQRPQLVGGSVASLPGTAPVLEAMH
jgi:hypothetical protein